MVLSLIAMIPNAEALQLAPRQQVPNPHQRGNADSSASLRSLGALLAKPKKKRVSPTSSGEVEIPANLRRKVTAKRPALGHIVPDAVKVKGTGGSANPRLRPQGKAREAGMNNPSMLKIAGGTARGRRLDSPTVYLRPMMGKVREAVYSTFTSFGLYDVDSTRHLDIFSGSGSVGLERCVLFSWNLPMFVTMSLLDPIILTVVHPLSMTMTMQQPQ